ncbi:MAG: Holliday junction branch migration DNA helicase RuvB [Acholeplasmatales bacterium]|jgi:Holliday junction DNA helicase RuvB|nr:Holliday junction branch migration DNA helicase RuvB [Acholeplasmatales bacterium]
MRLEEERLVDPLKKDEDLELRPKFLSEYIGQKEIKENIGIYIKAAKLRSESLDHILLYGPPGLGKTTLACIIANELEVPIKITNGGVIEKSGDLAAILSSLTEGEVLFIDEIHRLPTFIEEVLYSAMEDYAIDIVIGKDETTRTIRIDLAPFTLIGATTKAGNLSSPLRDRFGVIERLDYYSNEDLKQIIKRTSKVLNSEIEEEAINNLSLRSRGTPRIANRLFKRVRDFALVLNNGLISNDICNKALERLKIDSNGLDEIDKRYLEAIIVRFNGGPVGILNIAANISEDSLTLEDVIEPYLLKEGFIKRTSKGRVALKKAYVSLNLLDNYKGQNNEND